MTKKEKTKAYMKVYYEANKDKIRAKNKAWYESNKEKKSAKSKNWYELNKKSVKTSSKDYYKANRIKIRAYYVDYYLRNKETCRYYMSDWEKKNPQARSAINAKRRSKKLQATPPWLTKEHVREMQQIYKKCPKGYHVDHIIPLQGKTVCGLHVPWNLQHLPAVENRRKGNKLK